MGKRNRRKNQYVDNMYLWIECYNYWRQRLYDMAYSCIKWKGFDINVNPTTLLVPETFLVNKGMCAVFFDSVMGVLCLPCIGEGRLDVYGKPSSYKAYGNNGYSKEGLTPNEDCVIIYNNPIASSEHVNIDLFAKRLTNSMITGDINLSVHKTPAIILADEEQKLTAENMLAEIEGGAIKVFGNKSISNIELKALNLGAPFIADKIMENTQSIWNEWLNYLGVPSQVVQKKERMLRDEIQQTMGGSLASRTPRIEMREKAVEQLKKIFGWEVSFEYTVDSVPVPQYIGEGVNSSEGNVDLNGSNGESDREE